MVGYKQYELSGDEFMYTVGVQFKAMTASGDYTIDSKIFDTDAVAGDAVYVFDYQNWDLTCYTFVGYTDQGASRGWSVTYADGSLGSVSTFQVSAGDNLWLMTSDAISISGEVQAAGSTKLTFTVTDEDYMFEFANPYPIDTTFGDLETFCEAGDCFYTFNHVDWDLECFTYVGTGRGWSATYADGTLGTITDSSAVALPVGTGAFLMPGGSREWTVTFNY